MEAKDAKTWVRNLTQIKNAGLKRKILNVTAIAQGRTLKIHVRDIECSKVNSILLPALKKVGHVHRLTDEETMLNAPSDSTNVIVKLHIFHDMPNVEAKGAKTWVKNLTEIKNAGLQKKIFNVIAIAQGRTLKIHVRDIECSKVNSILLPL